MFYLYFIVFFSLPCNEGRLISYRAKYVKQSKVSRTPLYSFLENVTTFIHNQMLDYNPELIAKQSYASTPTKNVLFCPHE